MSAYPTLFLIIRLPLFGLSGDVDVQSESHSKDSLCHVFWFHRGSPRVTQMRAFGKLLLVIHIGSRINCTMPCTVVRIEGTCPVCGKDDGVLYFYITLEPSFICLYIYVHRPLNCGRTSQLIYTSGICSLGV